MTQEYRRTTPPQFSRAHPTPSSWESLAWNCLRSTYHVRVSPQHSDLKILGLCLHLLQSFARPTPVQCAPSHPSLHPLLLQLSCQGTFLTESQDHPGPHPLHLQPSHQDSLSMDSDRTPLHQPVSQSPKAHTVSTENDHTQVISSSLGKQLFPLSIETNTEGWVKWRERGICSTKKIR